jgi:hypothetical protein
MQTPSDSISTVEAALVASKTALLRLVSVRRFRMASTGQELLDLFEDRQALHEKDAFYLLASPLYSVTDARGQK